MLLVDQQGDLVASPIIESIQFRHFFTGTQQMFYEFTLDRDRLFTGQTGGLRPLARAETGFPLFRSPGVNFAEASAAEIETSSPVMLSLCVSCHGHLERNGVTSIISFFREGDFGLPDNQDPGLMATTPAREAQVTMAWKQEQDGWKALQALWERTKP